MLSKKSVIFLIIFSFFSYSPSFALYFTPEIVERFKEIITTWSHYALAIGGEFKNNAYYVNSKNGSIAGNRFNDVVIKFENITNDKERNELFENFSFTNLQYKTRVKFAGELTGNEIQSIFTQYLQFSIIPMLDIQISKDCLNIESKINTMFIPQQYLPEQKRINTSSKQNFMFLMMGPMGINQYTTLKLKVIPQVSSSSINLNIIDSKIDGEETSDELKKYLSFLTNPLFDFSKLDFLFSIHEMKILPNGKIRITGSVF